MFTGLHVYRYRRKVFTVLWLFKGKCEKLTVLQEEEVFVDVSPKGFLVSFCFLFFFSFLLLSLFKHWMMEANKDP